MPDKPSMIFKIIANNLINDHPVDLHDRDFLATIFGYHERMLDAADVSMALFNEFGTLSAIVAASYDQLMAVPGMTRYAVALLKFMNEFGARSRRSRLPTRIKIASFEDLQSYLHQRLTSARHEEFHVLFLDSNWNLLRDELMSRGCVDRCAVYPRQVLQSAINIGAAKLVLIHNHPSRQTRPSADDIKTTRLIMLACHPVDIVIEDHIIIAGDTIVSMRQLGLLDTRKPHCEI